MRLTIGLLMLSIALLFSSESLAQEKTNLGGYLVPMCVYNGDTIPAFQIPTIHIFKPLKFRNRKEQMEYYKLVRNVKKVYPIAREINRTIIETYEYLQTLPNEKARQRHIKRVEKGLKEQYTPRMKKLSFAQIFPFSPPKQSCSPLHLPFIPPLTYCLQRIQPFFCSSL